MARYQNGLALDTATVDRAGTAYCRWLYEFLVNVVGWSAVDVIGSKWNNYIGSGGAGTAVVSDAETLVITSPSYVFSTSDINKYLTLTGFTTGERDGVYRILDYVGSAGSDYTVKIDKRMGPHSNGLPSSESSSWKLWDVSTTYTPNTGDKLVVAGIGVTGAGTTTGNGTGDSISMAGSVATLTDATATFQTSDVGKSITISGATNPGNNGTFTIVSRVSATQITYTNASGVNETSSFAWQISYVYHLYIEVETTTYSMYPKISVSPFASWNAGSHSWNDNRYTAAKNAENEADQTECVIYAEASEQHIHSWVRSRKRIDSYDNEEWNVYLVEEFDSFYPDKDPRPVMCLAGDNEVNDPRMVGYVPSQASPWGTVYNATRGLGYDDVTTLVYVLSIPATFTDTSYNLMQLCRRKNSLWSKKQYRTKFVLESRTAGYFEHRGTVRNAWLTNINTRPMATLKIGSDYYRTPYAGFLMRSNGSRNWFPFLGESIYGG